MTDKHIVHWITLGYAPSKLGSLFWVSNEQLPFIVQRVFWISDVPNDEIRGDHAHRTCWQAMVPICGSCIVHLDKRTAHRSTARASFLLKSPMMALIVPPMHYIQAECFSPDAILLVLCSEEYQKPLTMEEFLDEPFPTET